MLKNFKLGVVGVGRNKCRICNPTTWAYADLTYKELLRKWQFYDDSQRCNREIYGVHATEMNADLEEKKRVITRAMARKIFG